MRLKKGVGLASFAIGVLDWIGRAQVVRDILKGGFPFVDLLTTPAWLSPVLIFVGVALLLWDRSTQRVVVERARSSGPGGPGGEAIAVAKLSKAIGGPGGDGGIGPGGAGGRAVALGEGSTSIGGGGGHSAQWDGRGGRGAVSGAELTGGPTRWWKYGAGGSGANAAEYDRRLSLLIAARAEYLQEFPARAPFVHAGIDQVPIAWINKRLEEDGESWRVSQGASGYVLPPLVD